MIISKSLIAFHFSDHTTLFQHCMLQY